MGPYSLPYKQKSSMKWYLVFFLLVFFMAGAGIFFLEIMEDDFIVGLLGGLFCIALSILFGYMIVVIQVLKKFSLRLTSECMEVVLPFKTITARWDEIVAVNTYHSHGNDYVAVLLKSDQEKKSKRSFSRNFESLYGVPAHSFQIPSNYFKDVDMNRLALTIGEQINNRLDSEEQIVDRIDHEKEENNIIGALSTSALICLILSIVYGISIWLFEENFIIIPILGSFFIISIFNKYYLEESFNLMVRLYVGFVCLLQIPLGIIIAVTFDSMMSFTINNIFFVAKEYFKYVVQYPSEQLIVIVIALICFGIGAIRGRVK